MAQNRQRFHEQPSVTWKMSERASEGGLNRGMSYSMGILLQMPFMVYVLLPEDYPGLLPRAAGSVTAS